MLLLPVCLCIDLFFMVSRISCIFYSCVLFCFLCYSLCLRSPLLQLCTLFWYSGFHFIQSACEVFSCCFNLIYWVFQFHFISAWVFFNIFYLFCELTFQALNHFGYFIQPHICILKLLPRLYAYPVFFELFFCVFSMFFGHAYHFKKHFHCGVPQGDHHCSTLF